MPEHNFNLDEMLKDPQAANLLKNKRKLQQLINSPDAKKLVELLSQKGGSDLQSAAKAAMSGDASALVGLMQEVMQRPEGAKAVEGISRNIPQK
jgi:hypothetical protein